MIGSLLYIAAFLVIWACGVLAVICVAWLLTVLMGSPYVMPPVCP